MEKYPGTLMKFCLTIVSNEGCVRDIIFHNDSQTYFYNSFQLLSALINAAVISLIFNGITLNKMTFNFDLCLDGNKNIIFFPTSSESKVNN